MTGTTCELENAVFVCEGKIGRTMDDHISPPFAQLSETDHGPIIIVATFILLIISFLAVAVKLWTRISTARRFVATDWTMILAIVRLSLRTTFITPLAYTK